MNRWNRPHSPSAIPRLLRQQPLSASADNLSRSPSPVKTTPGSKIPTPEGTRKVQRGSSVPNLSIHTNTKIEDNLSVTLPPRMDLSGDFSGLGLGDPLEEMLMPSSPASFSEEIEEASPLTDDHGISFGAVANETEYPVFLDENSVKSREEALQKEGISNKYGFISLRK